MITAMRMEIIPGEGTDIVKFGMTLEDVEARLGAPETVTPYNDQSGYPRGRENWNYGPLDLLVTSAHGVVAITVDCAMPGIILWGHSLSGCDANPLTNLMKQAGERIEIGNPDQWDDYDIIAPDAGLDCSFSGKELLSVEVQRPGWRQLD